MKITMVIVLSLTLIAASTAEAFNGKRKGFVMGGGIGVFDLPERYADESRSKVTFHASIGWGVSSRDLILIEGAGADSREVENWSGGTSEVFDKSFTFVSWYHYFSPSKSSWFAGIGFGKYNDSFLRDTIWESPHSLMASVGYERSHVSAKVYLLYIRRDLRSQTDNGQAQLGMMLGALAF